MIDVPVTFPPGWARLGTSPLLRIDDERHDNRDRPGDFLGSLGRRPTHDHDHARLQADQVGHEGGIPRVLALGPSGLQDDALTFHIAQLAQPLAEGFEAAQSHRVGEGTRRYVTDPGYLLLLLRLGGSSTQRRSKEEKQQSGGKLGHRESHGRPPPAATTSGVVIVPARSLSVQRAGSADAASEATCDRLHPEVRPSCVATPIFTPTAYRPTVGTRESLHRRCCTTRRFCSLARPARQRREIVAERQP